MLTQYLFWTCLFLIVYTYVIYPLVLFAASRLRRSEADPPHSSDDSDAEWPHVTMLVAAHNEAAVIEEKIANCLSVDYPEGRFRVVIASDGSEDGTNRIVAACPDPRVQLIAYAQRRGKIGVLNATIPTLEDEILVMSDANTMYAPDAVKKLVRHFANPRLGAVCGELVLETPDGAGSGEGLYWKYETLLKRLESRMGFLLGVTGGIFAVRRSLFRPLPTNTIVEDFVTGMRILEAGRRVCYEPEARATEYTAPSMGEEMRRKVRIGAGNFQAIGLTTALLNPLRGLPALGYWSHKIIRWCVPFLMLGAFLANVPLAKQPLYAYLLAAQCAAYAIGVQGLLPSPPLDGRLARPLRYFFVMNLALFLGFCRFIRGSQRVTWERAARQS